MSYIIRSYKIFDKMDINIVVIGAHPDDCEIKAGGTAAAFARRGHKILFVSVTNGSAGHYHLGREELSEIRKAESLEAARILGVEYIVLDNNDGTLLPSIDVREQIIRLIREWSADIVITHRTNDYHPDHRNTAVIVQDAAYLVMVPHIVPGTPPLKTNPVFLFLEDRFQKPIPFTPDIVVDITETFELKTKAMAAHKSQFFDWIPWISGNSSPLPEDYKGRLNWLAEQWKPTMDDLKKKSLAKWYGKDAAEKVKLAEAFEICEYGHQPSESEIKRLFPMLGDLIQ